MLVLAAACSPGGGSDTTPPDADVGGQAGAESLVGPLWVLDSLPGTATLAGSGGRAPDLRFGADGNAGGFTGCNSAGGPYHVTGDSIRIGPLAMTMMACDQGMELEQAYAGALDRAIRFARTDSTLQLYDSAGLAARFRVQ
jgi:heat shock protein HslJ